MTSSPGPRATPTTRRNCSPPRSAVFRRSALPARRAWPPCCSPGRAAVRRRAAGAPRRRGRRPPGRRRAGPRRVRAWRPPSTRPRSGRRSPTSCCVPDGTDGYVFRHALLREAVYADLLPGERTRLHAPMSSLLADEQRLAVPGTAAELAHHCLASHDIPGAFAASVRAGQEAERLAAPGRGAPPLRPGARAVGPGRPSRSSWRAWPRRARPARPRPARRTAATSSGPCTCCAGCGTRSIRRSEDGRPTRAGQPGRRAAGLLPARARRSKADAEAIEAARAAVDATARDPPSLGARPGPGHLRADALLHARTSAGRDWAERARRRPRRRMRPGWRPTRW